MQPVLLSRVNFNGELITLARLPLLDFKGPLSGQKGEGAEENRRGKRARNLEGLDTILGQIDVVCSINRSTD